MKHSVRSLFGRRPRAVKPSVVVPALELPTHAEHMAWKKTQRRLSRGLPVSVDKPYHGPFGFLVLHRSNMGVIFRDNPIVVSRHLTLSFDHPSTRGIFGHRLLVPPDLRVRELLYRCILGKPMHDSGQRVFAPRFPVFGRRFADPALDSM